MHKYYSSITELPVWNWWQFHETENYTLLLKNSKDIVCENKILAAERLQNDFIHYFGIDKKYKEYLRTKCEIEIAYNNQVLTGDYSTTLLIKVMENKIKETFADEKKSSYFGAIIAIEKFLGRKLEIKKESVYDVYNYINELKKWQKAIK